MAEKGQLGVFWGAEALFFVETAAAAPQRMFKIPFTTEAKGSIEGGPLSPAGMELISLIQNTVRQQKVSLANVQLSLPSRDIIFRSFVIPWMQPKEIHSVVEFEATKYIPFALEELSYSYHAMTITEETTRRIRLILAAIKKGVLENYTNILENASLNINVVEPAPVSLIRALMLKNMITPDQGVAIIEKGKHTGKIIIVNKGIPQFVREFQLLPASADQPKEGDARGLITNLNTEIRMSLNYFSRQDAHLNIKQIMLIEAANVQELSKELEQSLGMSVVPVNNSSFFGTAQIDDIDYLNAYGAGLAGAAGTAAEFNLSPNKPPSAGLAAPSLAKSMDYKSVVKTALVCIPLIIASSGLTHLLQNAQKKKAGDLKAKLSFMKDVDADKVQEKNAQLNAKLAHLRNIRIGSDAADFLAVIPALLPEGTWIDKLDILYPDAGQKTAAAADPAQLKPSIEISGYAYLPKQKDHFRLVGELFQNFKKNAALVNFFHDIDLETVEDRNLDNHSVTFFKLRCK